MKRVRPNRITLTMIKGLLLIEVVSLLIVMAVIFGLYRPWLQKQTLDEASAAGDALAAQIEIAVRSAAGYSGFYIQSPELLAALSAYENAPGAETGAAVGAALAQLQPAGETAVRTALVLREGAVLGAADALTEADRKILAADWMEALLTGTSSEEFAPFYARTEEDDDNAMLYLRAFPAGDRRYVLGLVCDTAQLEADVRRLSAGLFSGYALASMSGPSFFTAGELSGGADMLERHAGDASFRERDETGYYVASTVPTSQWKVLGFLSNETFNARFRSVLLSALLMCLLVCALAALLVAPFSQWLLRPAGQLRDAMERATRGELDARVSMRQDNELGELGSYFNHMLDEIQETRRKELEAEHRERCAWYDLLTSQINAHYIYNTMSSINSLARMGRCDDVIRVNSALIRILQNSLRVREGEMRTTVSRALEAVQSYWSIETVRPNNHASFHCETDRDVMDCLVLKNLFQPLVENSLRHGLTDEETGEIAGEIVLTIRREGDLLRIQVRDNGRGIGPERLAELNAPETDPEDGTRHIGLSNIRKRLAFAYQDRASLHLRSDGGTTVEIVCPLEQ